MCEDVTFIKHFPGQKILWCIAGNSEILPLCCLLIDKATLVSFDIKFIR